VGFEFNLTLRNQFYKVKLVTKFISQNSIKLLLKLIIYNIIQISSPIILDKEVYRKKNKKIQVSC